MIDSDRTEFGRDLTMLAEIFAEPVSEARYDGYFEVLKDLDVKVVSAAIRSAARTLKFFPKPGELRTFSEGDPETQATLAWVRFTQAIAHVGPDSPVTFGTRDAQGAVTLRPDDRAIHDTIAALGGWREINLLDQLPIEEQGYAGLQWRRLYQHFRTHPEPSTELVMNDELAGVNALRCLDARGLPEAVGQKALPPGDDVPQFDPAVATAALEKLAAEVNRAMTRPASDPARVAAARALGPGDKPLNVEPTEDEQAEHERRRQIALEQIKKLEAK